MAASNCWKFWAGNWVENMPVKGTSSPNVPMAVPLTWNDAIELEAEMFWRLNGEPGGVHCCPAAGGKAQAAGENVPAGMNVSLRLTRGFPANVNHSESTNGTPTG
jgi:hypothetical protein